MIRVTVVRGVFLKASVYTDDMRWGVLNVSLGVEPDEEVYLGRRGL